MDFDQLPPLFWRTYVNRAEKARRDAAIGRWIILAFIVAHAAVILGLVIAAVDYRIHHP